MKLKFKAPTILICLLFICSSIGFSVSSDTLHQTDTSILKLNQVEKIESFQKEPVLSYVEEQVGDQFLFWINIPDITQLRGTLLAKGNWSYIYMANETIDLLGVNASISMCESLSLEFDSTIYPCALEVAGHPDGNLGDIDGDPHITVFLAPLCRYCGSNSVLGYYDDKDDEIGNPYSNNREMFYVDSEHSLVDTLWIITHEFNHMIWGNYEYDEASFLLEGLANYNVDYNGYYSWVTDAVTTTYTYHPEISLLYFVREYGALWDASYGQAYLFVTYLAERFGNDFTRELVSTAADGAEAIDAALINFGYTMTFNTVYLDWITACTLDDPSFADGIYGFESVDYKIDAQQPIGYVFPIEKLDITHNYYGFEVKAVYGDHDNFTFVIENPYPYALGISIAFKDDSGWNVTQYFNTEQSDQISLYIEGTKIQEAYVITSLMSASTPSDFGVVYALSELPSEKLDYFFFEGRLEITDESSFAFVTFVSIVCLFLIAKIRRDRKLSK
ncbi:MAG: hypothetical protein GOP50_12210 [Candidatus Heimdallarchaeota archaeon]|nr:hypothetical protein [Candidatus Heimdallarchaeota archaeon]